MSQIPSLDEILPVLSDSSFSLDCTLRSERPSYIVRRKSKMKVGFGLRLQEAWRSHFESRPSQALVHSIKAVSKDAEQSSDDGSVKKQLSSPSPALPDSGFIGYRDECITVDARQNHKGQWVLMKGAEQFDAKADPSKVKRATSILDPYCIVVTRRFNSFGELEAILLEIQAPKLIQIIRELVAYYPDESFRIGDTIKFEDPPKLLYYYRKELAEYRDRAEVDERTKQHITFALNFLNSHLGDLMKKYEQFLDAGMINFGHLWMMFKPGILVYEQESEELYFLKNGSVAETPCGMVYALSCYHIDYNGEKLGKVERSIKIPGFGNPRTISSLPVLPLDFCEDPDAIKQKLLARAKRFMDLRGIHNLQHTTKGRVMVDAKTCLRRVLPGDEDRRASQKKGMVVYEECKCVCAVCKKHVDEKPEDYDHDVREITTEELLLCSSTVLGFALSSHKWIQMQIDDLTEIQWSADAIDRLVIDKRQKKVLSSLINSAVFTQGAEGDVIGWKGRGLVMLLHGQPGTGKTLTAESVCESLHRPLYIVSGGELGVNPQEVEKTLEEVLELSKLWRAVILIDEADVFLESRKASDIVRNNFVSGKPTQAIPRAAPTNQEPSLPPPPRILRRHLNAHHQPRQTIRRSIHLSHPSRHELPRPRAMDAKGDLGERLAQVRV